MFARVKQKGKHVNSNLQYPFEKIIQNLFEYISNYFSNLLLYQSKTDDNIMNVNHRRFAIFLVAGNLPVFDVQDRACVEEGGIDEPRSTQQPFIAKDHGDGVINDFKRTINKDFCNNPNRQLDQELSAAAKTKL